ncbi:hypothetical protein ACH4T9_12895 [Micromonospora sp. NPDC020750]|uniref:hypothetical protein n=1 Tax=unclassified Micromonospora TaxID=2617518 RepID=UPI0037A336CE
MADEKTTRAEITHPDWCQRDRCTTSPDGSVIHRHLFGTIATANIEADVTVERADEADGDRCKPGSERAYLRITRPGFFSAGDLDRVYRLMGRAATFSGQRNGRLY